MQAGIHKELCFKLISEPRYESLKRFLIESVVKKGWPNKDEETKIEWVKEWMDMPDSDKHGSKLKNDHSYKISIKDNKTHIEFAKSAGEQATVVARLKYAARDIKEWKEEEEFRVCGLELLKSIHWVVDFTSPSHTVAGWPQDMHSKIEEDFDKTWETIYSTQEIKFNRTGYIKDIYRWAKDFIEKNYKRNCDLLALYQKGGSIKKGEGIQMGQAVIKDVIQNLADYFAYIDKKIDYKNIYNSLIKENQS